MPRLRNDGTLREGLQDERKGQKERKGRREGIWQRQGQNDERNRKERRRQVRTFQGRTRRTKRSRIPRAMLVVRQDRDTSRRNVDGESTTLMMMTTK